jgi:hypothetical protein
MFEHVVWAEMSQEEVKARMQFARLNRLYGINRAGLGKEVQRERRGGEAEEMRSASSNG